MNDGLEDDALLAQCIDGNARAWEQFVLRYSRYVYFLINATAQKHGARIDENEAADLHNDFFVALLEGDRKRLRSYEGKNGCSIRSWLRIICIRRTIDSLRRRRKHVSIDDRDEARSPLELVDGTPDALGQLLQRDAEKRRSQLDGLTRDLSPTDRLLLELIYVRKLSADEISAALRIRKGAVYTRKTRLIRRLQDLAKSAGLLDADHKGS